MPGDSEQPKDERSDEQLMAAYVAGDERAFRVLFDRYGPVLFRLVRRRLRTDDEARDIVQTTLLHMHRARHDFRHDSRLRPWLFTIALNLVREHYRRRGRRKEQPLEIDGYSPAEPTVQPGTPIEDRQRAERLHAALASLPENQRTVIELHWFGDSPYEEIARIVGASVAAVRVRAHRGYERLRKILPENE
ncbi:MAG: RNA polymerase sigma factor [Myxococcales bacterium]|nr:RNA polymerase sigma factor [Myxococcales bacterium]